MKVFSRFFYNPGLILIELIKHILQYIFETIDLDLKFDREVNILNNVMRYYDKLRSIYLKVSRSDKKKNSKLKYLLNSAKLLIQVYLITLFY